MASLRLPHNLHQGYREAQVSQLKLPSKAPRAKSSRKKRTNFSRSKAAARAKRAERKNAPSASQLKLPSKAPRAKSSRRKRTNFSRSKAAARAKRAEKKNAISASQAGVMKGKHRPARSEAHKHKPKPVPLFPRFGELPIELRLLIWSFVELTPVIISPVKGHPTHSDCANYIRPVPPVLQACKESRKQFLYVEGKVKPHPTYKLCSGLSRLNSRNKVYIAFEIDTVIASAGTFFSRDLTALRHIGYYTKVCLYALRESSTQDEMDGVLLRLPKLETVKYYIDDFDTENIEKVHRWACRGRCQAWFRKWRNPSCVDLCEMWHSMKRMERWNDRPVGWKMPTIWICQRGMLPKHTIE